MLHLIFDNTKKIKDFAKSYNPVEEKGKEQQQFNIGDVVTHTEKSRYRFGKGTICEVYENNGYFYYIIKENGLTFRQTDLIKL
jgi:hypothetical protein